MKKAAVFILLGQSNAVGHGLPMAEEDKILLKSIYEPKVVIVPPCDASNSMCITTRNQILSMTNKTPIATIHNNSPFFCNMLPRK